MKRVICFALLLASVTATTAAQDIAFDDLEWQTFNTSGGVHRLRSADERSPTIRLGRG